VRQVDTPSILKNQSINESETTQNRMASIMTTFAMKTRTGIACWNARTLLESSRLNKAAREMNAYNISISGLSETTWNGFGDLELQTSERFMYSGQENENDRHQDGGGFLLARNSKHSLLDWQPV
jgi:hypothetical protein